MYSRLFVIANVRVLYIVYVKLKNVYALIDNQSTYTYTNMNNIE